MAENGWPATPGVPENPEREAHHWCFVYPSLPFPMIWRHDGIGWVWGNGYCAEDAAKYWRYLGPCLLPSEVAAREAAAYKRGFDDGQAGLDGAVTAARRAGIEEVARYMEKRATGFARFGYDEKAETTREWAHAIRALLTEKSA